MCCLPSRFAVYSSTRKAIELTGIDLKQTVHNPLVNPLHPDSL